MTATVPDQGDAGTATVNDADPDVPADAVQTPGPYFVSQILCVPVHSMYDYAHYVLYAINIYLFPPGFASEAVESGLKYVFIIACLPTFDGTSAALLSLSHFLKQTDLAKKRGKSFWYFSHFFHFWPF